jgi:antitoxin PrlF
MNAKLTSKGTITIPKAVRDAMGVKSGDRIEFIRMADGRFFVIPLTVKLMQLEGIIPKPAAPVSLEEMKQAIADGASGN